MWKTVGISVAITLVLVIALNRFAPGVMGNYDAVNYEGEEYQ